MACNILQEKFFSVQTMSWSELMNFLFLVFPHSKKKSTSEHLFWCFRLSQIENSIQYLEVPNGIWKDHDRQIGVPGESAYHGPSRCHLVLPGTE